MKHRGCLACGSLSSYFDFHFLNKHLNDSKKLSKKQLSLRPIIEKEASAWGVGIVSPQEIDEINILNATFLAMHRAIKKLKQKPEKLLIDGNRFNPYKDVPHHCIIKGDGKFLSIAAASVLAKTYRDEIMEKLDLEFNLKAVEKITKDILQLNIGKLFKKKELLLITEKAFNFFLLN